MSFKNDEYIITFNYYDEELHLSIESLRTPKGKMKGHQVDGDTYVIGDFNLFEINRNIICNDIIYCELEYDYYVGDTDTDTDTDGYDAEEDYKQSQRCICNDCTDCDEEDNDYLYVPELIDDYFQALFDGDICCEECEIKAKKLLVDLYMQGVEDILNCKGILKELVDFNDEFGGKH